MNRKVKNIILQSLVWLGLISFLAVSMSFVSGKRSAVVCTEAEINISEANEFIDEAEVKEILAKSNLYLPGFLCDSLKLDSIEKTLAKHNQVKSVESFMTVDGKLVINIRQRKPVVRVFDENGGSFYIDEDGKIMKTSSRFTPRVLVATGKIRGVTGGRKSCILSSTDNYDFAVLQLFQIYQLASKINTDPFMFAMTDQIYINNKLQVELIPKLAGWTIVIGNNDDIDGKFSKFRSFLQVVPYPDGWEKYSVIDLSFKNQIVCTKKPII